MYIVIQRNGCVNISNLRSRRYSMSVSIVLDLVSVELGWMTTSGLGKRRFRRIPGLLKSSLVHKYIQFRSSRATILHIKSSYGPYFSTKRLTALAKYLQKMKLKISQKNFLKTF